MLSEIVAKRPSIHVATEKDNEAILEFFAKVAMDTQSLQLRYNRSPDFFSFLNVQGDHAVVFTMINDDGSVGGVGVITSRKCIVDGKEVNVSYLSDLRIDPRLNKRVRVHWRRTYIDVIENCKHIKELGNPDYFYSAIINDNKDAIRAFTKASANPVYRPIIGYQTISILGRFSRITGGYKNWKRGKSEYTYGFATEEDFLALKEFLYYQNRDKKLGVNFTESGDGELERRLKLWPEFEITSFFLVKDENGKIIGCTAPWGSSTLRKLVVDKASLANKILGQMMPVWGRKRVVEGEELKVLYLTSLEIDSARDLKDRSEIFGNIIDELFYRRVHIDYHIVSFIDFNSCSFLEGLKFKGYITNVTNATLYQVLSQENFEREKFLESGKEEIVGFDLGIA